MGKISSSCKGDNYGFEFSKQHLLIEHLTRDAIAYDRKNDQWIYRVNILGAYDGVNKKNNNVIVNSRMINKGAKDCFVVFTSLRGICHILN